MTWSSVYEQLFRDLGVACDATHGVSAPAIEAAELELDVTLPAALRDFYLVAGSHPFCRAYNRLLGPAGLSREPAHLVIAEENQNAVCWGVRLDSLLDGAREDDPQVWQAVNSEPMKWFAQEASVSEFLRIMLYWQAVNGGFEFAGAAPLGETSLAQVEATWPKIADHDGLTIFAKPEQVVCVMGPKDDLQVLAAGSTRAAFHEIDRQLRVTWDWSALQAAEAATS